MNDPIPAPLLWVAVGVVAVLATAGVQSPAPLQLAVIALGAVALVPLAGWLGVPSFLPVAAAGTGAIASALVLSAGQAVAVALIAATVAGALAGAALMSLSRGDAAVDVIVSLAAAVAVWGAAVPAVTVTGSSDVVLLGIDLSGDRALAYTAALVLAAAVWGLGNAARSPLGRSAVVTAVDPVTAGRAGVDVGRMRLEIGVISGVVAAWAGALLTLDAQTMPAPGVLAPAVGVLWLGTALAGGRLWVSGALAGALLVGGVAPVVGLPPPAAAGIGLVIVAVTGRDGLVAVWQRRGAQ